MDLSRIRGGMITGIESEDINFLNELLALNPVDVFDQRTGLTQIQTEELENDYQFEDLPDNIIKEIETETIRARNKNTAEQTKIYVNKFRDFLRKENKPTDFETIPNRYLSQYLTLWYFRMKKADGGLFAPSTLICAHAAIQRHLQTTRNINSIDDTCFQLARTH